MLSIIITITIYAVCAVACCKGLFIKSEHQPEFDESEIYNDNELYERDI